MSSLDLIRSLRRAMAALREADNPVAVSRVARTLADELEADLDQHPTDTRSEVVWTLLARDGAAPGGDDPPVYGIEMSVCA